MSYNGQEKIVEDAPRMRSVMMGAPAMPMARAFPSPLLHSKPAAIEKTKLSVESRASTAAASWIVRNVTPFPSMYFLERTHVYVAAAPQEIATRIADCLRNESVATSVPQVDEAMLRAQTYDHVEFVVRLWLDKSQVVVEVQRSAGCCVGFHRVCKAVLRAAKGLPPSNNSSLRCADGANNTRRRFTIPESIPLQSVEESDQCNKEGIEIACTLLKLDRLDARRLAVESLVHITSNAKCAKVASDIFLHNEELLKTLVSLATAQPQTGRGSEMEREHLYIMKRNALTVLANCLVSLEKDGSLRSVVCEVDNLRSPLLLGSLVAAIGNAGQKPHEAHQAVRCMKVLMKCGMVDIHQTALQMGVPDAVRVAHEEGMCRHAELEHVSRELRAQMGQI